MIPSVRRYYDQNTRLFLKLGSTPGARAIHRALWPPGIVRLEDALHVTNHLILSQAQDLAARDEMRCLNVADLGCGVGGTVLFLLKYLPLPARAVGITISPLQARLGGEAVRQSGLDQVCLLSEADFLAVPAASECFDLVYSVEAAVHAPDPACFYSEAARILRPGGRLVLVDDFQTGESYTTGDVRLWLDAYQTGWQTPGLLTPARAEILAAQMGLILVETRDLTPLLRIRALPRWLALLVHALGRSLSGVHAILPSMLGSLALQQCLRMGCLSYRLLVFEKQP